MGAGVLFSPATPEPRVFRIAGAIIRHTGRGSCDRRGRNNSNRRSLDDNLRRRDIGGGAGFLGGFVGGSATTDNEKRSAKTQDANQRYFHFTNVTHPDRSRSVYRPD